MNICEQSIASLFSQSGEKKKDDETVDSLGKSKRFKPGFQPRSSPLLSSKRVFGCRSFGEGSGPKRSPARAPGGVSKKHSAGELDGFALYL